jgi:hypothetical protein
MTQNYWFLRTTRIGLFLCAVSILASSCIDELYDLSNGISKEMSLLGDSLAIPIGSTDTILLKNILDEYDLEMLKTMEEGGYAFTKADSVVPIIEKIDTTNLVMADKDIEERDTVSFGDINLKDFAINGISVDKDVSLNMSSVSLGAFAVPSFSKSSSTRAGISDYALTSTTVPDKTANCGKDHFLSGITLPSTSADPAVEVPIENPAPIAFRSTATLDYSVSVPKDVKNISNILLKDGAMLEVTLELDGANEILTAGTISPSVTVDPSNLFVFDPELSGGAITFGNGDELTVANGFSRTKTYSLSQINLSGNPLLGKLDVSKEVSSTGSMSVYGAKVMSNKIDQIAGMDLIVKVAIKNVEVESMEFDIPTLTLDIPTSTTTLNIDNSIPTEINRLNKVILNNPSTVSVNMRTFYMPTMISRSITINQLNISFPSQFVFEPVSGLSGSTYSITNEAFNPSTGRDIQLNLNHLNMANEPVTDGRLTWSGAVSFAGSVSISGRINSKNIPTSESLDTKMDVDMTSALSFHSAEVVTNIIKKTVPPVSISVPIKEKITTMVKRLNSVHIEDGTMLRIDITKPTLPLTLEADNIHVVFPDLFTFNPPLPMNTLTLDNELPEYILLELDSLNINQDLTDGYLIMNENILISGGVKLLSGTVNSTEIEGLTDKFLNLKASTSDLSISSTSVILNDLGSSTSGAAAIEYNLNSIPTQILSLDSILLADHAKVEFSIEISNMPDLGAENPLYANINITFPDMFLLAPDANITNNVLTLNRNFVNGNINKTIGIRGLKFDGKALNGTLNIDEDLVYTASVSAKSPTVNSEELQGKPIVVLLHAKMSGISFDKVYGQFEPGVDPVKETLALDMMPDFMYKEGVVLDVTRPIIALTTECNLGVPIDASFDIIPRKNGTVVPNATQSFLLSIPKAPSTATMTKTSFWISPDSAGMPQGYQFIDVDVSKLFRTVPDMVNFNATINSNRNEQHFIDLKADYNFKVNYEVTVPLAFGEDLQLFIVDTVSITSPDIGKMALEAGVLEIVGTMLNSIPMELELELVPLDEDNNPIDIDPVTQIINPGARDGSAVSTTLSLTLEDPFGVLKDIRGLQLNIKASSNETVAGAPIRPDNFVKADLKAKLSGGINYTGQDK